MQDDLRHVTWTQADGIVLVRFRLGGPKDFDVYEVIAQDLKAVAAIKDVKGIVLNLDVFDHLTSRLLGAMIAFSKQLSQDGRKLAVCRIRPEPMRVFRVCRMDTMIPAYDTEAEAQEALST